ncbi:MAG: MerR family transcriptional regulator [Lachnospiraceae bacterium]|nr:MerR family transcriptional regulator [Lachnospiraceae bacterium]MCI9357726.1 MerR family transcriptional regulator [Lachnospiraceae bacterium]
MCSQLDEKVVLVTLTQEQLKDLNEAAARIGAAEAFKYILQEKENRNVLIETRKVTMTKELLSSYKSMKEISGQEQELTEAEKVECRWKFLRDLMGNREERSEAVIKDTERRIQENTYALGVIEQAVSMYRTECEKNGMQEGARGLRALEMLYLIDGNYDVKKVAEVENVSEKTIYKNIKIACKGLSYYIFGL